MFQSQIELLIMWFQTGNSYILNLFTLADAFKHKPGKGAERNANAGRLVSSTRGPGTNPRSTEV